ncbi:MAG: hypothetical protein K2N06_04015 [Oscillospiraceae bacterium]|nr:hypothetical protein [Oscillospiraceae bacterium]
MLIYSQDKRNVADANLLQVQRIIGGKKDAKYAIMAFGESTGQVIVAQFSDEKTATDALEKAFQAFELGAKTYRF